MSRASDPNAGRWWLRRIVGVFFLFSGAALLMHILGGVPLLVGLAGMAIVAVGAFAYVWRQLNPLVRAQLRSHVRIGIAAGVLAVVAYDIAKWGLAVLDPSSFDPFGAVPIFGALIVGTSAPTEWLMAAGIGYHVLNGVTFAVAYSVLFGRRGALAGIGWGVFLEAFQFTLYPGWLNTAAVYAEFVTISFFAHVVYGATLGYVCKRGLTRTRGGVRRQPGVNS